MPSNLLILVNRCFEDEPPRNGVEDFVSEHCYLDDEDIDGLWIHHLSAKTMRPGSETIYSAASVLYQSHYLQDLGA